MHTILILKIIDWEYYKLYSLTEGTALNLEKSEINWYLLAAKN